MLHIGIDTQQHASIREQSHDVGADERTDHAALALIKSANDEGIFDDVPFEQVWSLLRAAAKADD